MRAPLLRVWDLPVRLMHWALAAGCAAGWITTAFFTGWHEAAGYLALALVVLRVYWGFAGSPYARFRQFVRAPRAAMDYARLVRTGQAPRYLGHNPLGGWMAIALWACVGLLGITGWLYSTDLFWGNPWLDLGHQTLAWTLLLLVSLHVAGVLHTSRQQSENLLTGMVTGDKRAASCDDIT